jgi:hypothetical protein
VANFYNQLPDVNPNQLYVVLEINEDDERSRADSKPLNTCLSFPPIKVDKVNDLEALDVDIADLVGHNVTRNKTDYSKATRKFIKLSEQEIMLDFAKGVKSVEINIWLTIEAENGKEHSGTLFGK